MQYVSSLGGPRVLLPTSDVKRWIDELGPDPMPQNGLYGLACSVNEYCGVIRPWGTPILIFGDLPNDIFWLPLNEGGIFVRWVGADSLDQLIAFARSTVDAGNWTERTEWVAETTNYTLMDTCTFTDDTAPRITINIPIGSYTIESQYAESNQVMAIIQLLQITEKTDG